jgi:hypothetical protein
MRRIGFAMCALALAACGDDGATTDAATDAGGFPDEQFPPVTGCATTLSEVPATLAETGLCADAGCAEIEPEATLYAPQFELYSDTATKRRWICLPPGTQIDTSNMNAWSFPVGTRVWKEFTRDGTRVETRMITKVMADDATPGAWLYAAYAWNATQDATTLAPPASGVQDANGTPHDIPSKSQCKQCHEGVPGRVLGFSAIQLDHDAPEGTLDLDGAIAAGMLSAAPDGTTPRFPLPGAQLDHDALGYLHANCGHCHNPDSPTHDVTPLELRLDTTRLATLQDTPVYATAYDVNGTIGGLTGKIIDPMTTDDSVMLIRFRSTDTAIKMPKLGTELHDTAGDTVLSTWIPTLP